MENNDLKNINNIAKLSIKTLEYAEKKKEEIDKAKEDIDKVKEDIDCKADKIGKAEYAIKLMSNRIEDIYDQTPTKVELDFLMKKAKLIEETNQKRRTYEIVGFVILVIYSTINFFI